MGADGGYCYFRKDEFHNLLGEDFELWHRFNSHFLSMDTWKEEVDVYEWQRKHINYEFYRIPYGTDLQGNRKAHVLDEKYYVNPPEEVWFYKEFMEDHYFYGHFNGYLDHYVFNDPDNWFYYENGLQVIPTPDELYKLRELSQRISDNLFPDMLETWT